MIPSDTLNAQDYAPEPVAASAVSWGAILAGAVGAAALSLILLMLGVGLGLTSVSPWARTPVDAVGIGVSTIVWVILTQLLASAMGGFLAGRLRTKWASVHSDEVFFRDTAHGFLAWAMASLATATLLTSMIASIVGTAPQAFAPAENQNLASMANGAPVGRVADPMAYYVDSLFRPALATVPANATTPAIDAPPADAEIARIFQKAFPAETLPADDIQYVGQMVTRYTGLTQLQAQQRVGETYLRMQTQALNDQKAAKSARDKASKAAAHVSLWLFISLLVGAFVASFSATWGGQLRDD